MIRRNILFSLFSQMLLILLTLLSTRYIFRELGAEVLGVINFSVTLTSLLIVFSDMGITPMVTREVAAWWGRDKGYVRNLIRSASLLAWAVFAIFVVVAVLLSPVLSQHWLQSNELDANETVMALQLIAISLLLAIPRAVYGSVVNGFQRVDLWNLANIWNVALQQLGLIVVLMLGGGLWAVTSWYLVSALLGLAPFVYLVGRLAGVGALRPVFHFEVLRRNLHFGSRLFASSLAGYLVAQADRWAVSKFMPLGLLGFYGFAQGLVSKGAIVPGAVSNAAFPALSENVEGGDRSGWLSRYNKLQDFTCYVYVPISFAIAMLGGGISRLVFNADVQAVIQVPLLFLAIGQLLQGVLYVPGWLAIAMRKPQIVLRANLWALVTVLPFTVFLTYRFGLNGAAIAAILYGAWQCFYVVPRFSAECLGRPTGEWVRHNAAFLVVGMVSYGLAWGVAWSAGEGSSLGGLAAAYTAGTLLFAVVAWFVLAEELRETMRSSAVNMLIALRGGRA